MGKDAVEEKVKKVQEETQLEGMKTFDLTNFTMDDFKPVPVEAARKPHPFVGYPSPKVKIGERMVNGKPEPILVPRYSIVIMNPKEPDFQDPSGVNQTIRNQRTGQEKTVNISAGHSRYLRDYDEGILTTVVFDRKLKLENGSIIPRSCIVKSHSVRAQLMFKYNIKTERVEPDNRYLFLDTKQAKRLREVFLMIINPKIKNERLSKSISGESDELIEEVPATELE